jgi:NRPS condensation-like uncharacterized protein
MAAMSTLRPSPSSSAGGDSQGADIEPEEEDEASLAGPSGGFDREAETSPGTNGHARASLQARLEDAHQQSPTPAAAGSGDDPVGLIRTLEDGGRFHRDRWLGRIFHPGKISFRESRSDNSLHITVDGNRMSAHVDRVSPLDLKAKRASRYSLLRVASHNVSGMAGDLVRLLRGRQGDHRCELDCQWGEPPPKETPGESTRPSRPPWNVQVELRVSGRLDESRLGHAFAETLGRHWASTGGADPLSVVDCPDEAALNTARAELQGLALPLGAPPLRARLARRPGGDVVMANFHHAVIDGFAALQVLRSVARSYAGQAPPPPPLDLLALHDLPVGPAATGATRGVWLYRAAVESVRNLLTPPALLVPDHTGEEPGFGYHLVNLPEDATRALVHFDHPGTSTDVLLAALHLAIASWNAEHGRPGGRISVLVSANLRSSELPQRAVGNFSTTARVSTSRRRRVNTAEALEAVTAQTGRNRRSRTGTALLEALSRSGLLALWAKQSVIVLEPVTGNRNVDTAMLCNLGRLSDAPVFGDDAGEATEVWFSPPTRIPVGLSIGAATISGRLHLVFRYPHRLFDDDAARRFAECYVHQLRLAAESSRTTKSPKPVRAALNYGRPVSAPGR